MSQTKSGNQEDEDLTEVKSPNMRYYVSKDEALSKLFVSAAIHYTSFERDLDGEEW